METVKAARKGRARCLAAPLSVLSSPSLSLLPLTTTLMQTAREFVSKRVCQQESVSARERVSKKVCQQESVSAREFVSKRVCQQESVLARERVGEKMGTGGWGHT